MATYDKNIGEYLQSAFQTGHAAHAYIVVGERQQLPQLLKECAEVCICRQHGGDGCDVCNKVKLGIHQDVLTYPQDKDRVRLNVADMQNLVDESYKRPIDNSLCRVFLIDASNSTAGVAAEVWQNKLLKTLEEPMPDTYIFVGVTDSEALLPTIRSRCQVLKQTRFSVQDVMKALQKMGYEQRFCEIAAVGSFGSVETGERILANPAVMAAFRTACNVLANMTSSKNALQHVSAILADKENVSWCLTYMTVLLRESIVYRLADSLCLLPSYTDIVEKICQNYTLQAAEVCIEKINSAKKRLDDGGNLTVVVDQLTSTLLEVKFRCRT